MSVIELADKVGITMANVSELRNGRAKAIRFSKGSFHLLGPFGVRLACLLSTQPRINYI
jgi:hypothetical protein